MKRTGLRTLLFAFFVLLMVAAPVSAASNIPDYHGSRHVKVVALTFDDGYSPLRVRQILAILESNHVPATFFPYANAMKLSPTTWRMVAKAGYPVGDHTISHPDLTTLSTASDRSQICGFRHIADPILGKASLDWFRPPYGAWNARIAAVAASCGYGHMLLWDVDTRDWSGISSSLIASRALGGTDGSIILMHAGPANTPAALQRIINGYRARGFKFVTIPQLLGSNG
jgi:peptidoglycan/xylan/chitin deacetylase (PgdA/CDA1 family)